MSNEKRTVIVFSTGGTLEKSYSESEGSLLNRESVIEKRLLSKLRLPYTKIEHFEIMAKDSLYMTDQDRALIWQKIKQALTHKTPIVVLHGTDTMELTANHCFRQEPSPPVPVIFTGAMRPLGYEDSDAPQNFIEALTAAQIANPGFYISFHNKLFLCPNVTKNKIIGTFEEPSP